MIPCLAVITLRLYDHRLLDAVLREDAGSCSRKNVIKCCAQCGQEDRSIGDAHQGTRWRCCSPYSRCSRCSPCSCWSPGRGRSPRCPPPPRWRPRPARRRYCWGSGRETAGSRCCQYSHLSSGLDSNKRIILWSCQRNFHNNCPYHWWVALSTKGLCCQTTHQ